MVEYGNGFSHLKSGPRCLPWPWCRESVLFFIAMYCNSGPAMRVLLTIDWTCLSIATTGCGASEVRSINMACKQPVETSERKGSLPPKGATLSFQRQPGAPSAVQSHVPTSTVCNFPSPSLHWQLVVFIWRWRNGWLQSLLGMSSVVVKEHNYIMTSFVSVWWEIR